MWLKLTQMPGENQIRINSDNIEAYGATDENGASSYLNTNNGSYQVKESVKEIDAIIYPGDGGWK